MNESRRSWDRQNSGALLCRIPKSGDSGYGFRLKAKTQPGARRFDTVARSIFKFTKDKMAQIFVFAT